MPFQPSIPNTGEIVSKQDQLMGQMQIHELHLFIDPNDDSGVKAQIQWSEGYVSGDVYTALKFHKATITGANLIAKIAEATTGNSVYDEVKLRAWQLLQMEPADKEEKYVGDGNIT